MAEQDWLTEQFEQSRPHLQAVAYSMLGTVSEAQDAVQEAWLRLHRSNAAAIGDLRGWLTTVVARISLDLLRARKARREVYPGSWLPEPLVDDSAADGPEHHAVLADSVGLALLVVLETLSPPERLAFVLHDVFAVPFDDIAQIMDKTPESARQLASRARRRVQAAPQPDRDLARQRQVVGAFLAAARDGDFEALLEVLDPGVVFRMDLGPGSPLARAPLAGATPVARYVLATAPRFVNLAQPVLVNGEAGALFGTRDDPIAVIGFTIAGGRIAALNLVADQAKLRNLTIQPQTPSS
jgi:RNA polymerase sigma factor (sigma-70 family)